MPEWSRCTPTAYRAEWLSCSSTRGFPPVDSARPVSTTRPSSISRRTAVEIVAPVSPVCLIKPARRIVPAARITSITAAWVLTCDWALAAPTTAPPPAGPGDGPRHCSRYRSCTVPDAVSYKHLRAHETDSYLVCR